MKIFHHNDNDGRAAAAMVNLFMDKERKTPLSKENFIEVYVKANLETCRERDPKGLYKKQIANFTGIESAYEEPKNPDLILDTEKFELEVCVDKVLEKIMEKICYNSHTVNCNENIVKSIGKEML